MTSTYYRQYGNFAGVDLASHPRKVEAGRLSRLKNMWRDYRSQLGGALETAPGYRKLCRFDGEIHGLFGYTVKGEEYIVLHAGTSLYRFPTAYLHKPRKLASLSHIAKVKAQKSTAVSVGDRLFFLDGDAFYVIDEAGHCRKATEDDVAYLPTTRYNGEEYEQRNLLSSRVKHIFTMEDIRSYSDHTSGLIYTVTSESRKTVSVAGSEETRSLTLITVPSAIFLNGDVYTVTSVANLGFSGFENLTDLHLPSTLETVGVGAFRGCTALSSAALPEGVTEIKNTAFADCTALANISIPSTLISSFNGAFRNTPALSVVYYAGTAAEYGEITFVGTENLNRAGLTVEYGSPPQASRAGSLRLPLYDAATEVLSVTVGNETKTQAPYEFSNATVSPVTENGTVTALRIESERVAELTGVRVECVLRIPYPETGGISGQDAIGKCTLAESYDGRIFFAGNPACPNTVFYTNTSKSGKNEPLYAGELNYFTKEERGKVSALLSVGGALLVFKDDLHGEGAVYCHTRAETGINLLPVIYPATEGLSGVGSAGAAISFLDDPVFLSRRGVWGVEGEDVRFARAFGHRSHAIDPLLLTEAAEKGVFAVFEGYLLLLTEGRIYLADSRQRYSHLGHPCYEWYLWEDIGSYTEDSLRYRYATVLPSHAGEAGVSLCPFPNEEVKGTVYSIATAGGTVYYVQSRDGEALYAVDSDGERVGGAFSPAVCLLSFGERLLFGTKDGTLSAFNTDRRGVHLYREKSSEGYYILQNGSYLAVTAAPDPFIRHTEEETVFLPLYRLEGGRYKSVGNGVLFRDADRLVLCEAAEEETEEPWQIPRYYYTHQGHAYESGFALPADDCGIPHLAKSTLPRSFVVCAKRFPGSSFRMIGRTDRRPWEEWETKVSGGSFRNMDFSALDFRHDDALHLVCREKERAWCEKQIQFYSNGFRAPFGIYSVAFRYRTAGRIRE